MVNYIAFLYFQLTVGYHWVCRLVRYQIAPSHPVRPTMKVSVPRMRGERICLLHWSNYNKSFTNKISPLGQLIRLRLDLSDRLGVFDVYCHHFSALASSWRAFRERGKLFTVWTFPTNPSLFLLYSKGNRGNEGNGPTGGIHIHWFFLQITQCTKEIMHIELDFFTMRTVDIGSSLY